MPESFLIKLQALACDFVKKRLWLRCFSVNFSKFLKAPFLIERLRWLLLKERSEFQIESLQRERERERERERVRLKSTVTDRNGITISYINAMK